MPRSHQFDVTPANWPTNEPAKRAKLSVTRPSGETFTLSLSAGELRSLVRAALTGLGYTKIVRSWHGKQAGWENRIERKVQPAMQMIEGIFPKTTDRVADTA
jgi:hypothetical protein